MLEHGKEFLLQYGPSLLAAIAISFIGKWVAKWIKRLVARGMTRAEVDPMIVSFTTSMIYIGLMVFVVIAALGEIGIQTTSFIAILGAAGLAIGLALQGSLANFAAGFMLIIFRPFKVGDVIEAAGVTGKVDEIQIFTTTLRTPDNKTIIIPNGKLGNDNIRCPPWRAKRRRVVPGSREATRDTRRAEGAKGDPKGASERGVQSYGRPVCSRNELAMLWRNAG